MGEVAVWSNLDFEYELIGGVDFRANPPLQKLCRRWRAILRLLPGCEQAELEPRSGVCLVPWGVTPSVLRLAPGQGLPDPELVRRLNDKRVSHELELELGCALPGARVVGGLRELDEAVAECQGDWVLKHPLGVGGRERVTGKRGREYSQARRWAELRFQEGWTLLFEPWVYGRREYSFHFEIAEAEAVFLGQCELVSDESGAFRGNRLDAQRPLDEELLETVRQAMERIRETGYRGPVSVDAFRTVCKERPVARPIMEINARYSFGRLALELFSRVPKGWSLHWWHPKARERAAAARKAAAFPNADWCPGLYRLPEFADPGGASGSYLVVES